MQIKRADFEHKASLYAQLSPETIHCVSEKVANGDYSADLGTDERAVHTLMQDVQSINSTVMGSNAARMAMHEEIRSMVAQHGVPSFFITINPADVYNPLISFLAGKDIDIENLPASYKFDYFTQSKLIAENPVLASRFFDIYMNYFYLSVLGYTAGWQRKKGLFGYTKAFYGCVEAQGHGTIHCHMLVWLERALNPSEIREKLLFQLIKNLKKN